MGYIRDSADQIHAQESIELSSTDFWNGLLRRKNVSRNLHLKVGLSAYSVFFANTDKLIYKSISAIEERSKR